MYFKIYVQNINYGFMKTHVYFNDQVEDITAVGVSNLLKRVFTENTAYYSHTRLTISKTIDITYKIIYFI